MKKTITIITHQSYEIAQITGQMECLSKEIDIDSNRKIIVYQWHEIDQRFQNEKLDFEKISEKDGQKCVLLFHATVQTFKKWKIKFNVNSDPRNHSDREFYKKLFCSDPPENINQITSQIFDEVWDYFYGKASESIRKKDRIDFLDSIYNGRLIQNNELPDFVQSIKHLIPETLKYFSENHYKKELDQSFNHSDADENLRKDQYQHLCLLRDAILNY